MGAIVPNVEQAGDGCKCCRAAAARATAPGPDRALQAAYVELTKDRAALERHRILAWYTLTRLDRLGVGGGRLGPLAASIRDAVGRHQVVADGSPPRYAYATDLAGGKLDHHDANDLPMALAPAWGFCEPDDPVWRATMRFAFGPANPGFAPARYGGLGSLHTPRGLAARPRPGVAGRLGRRRGRHVAAAQRALASVALWDGALPEASDPRSARPRSRLWFAWPGATVGSLLLDGLGPTAG